LGLTFIKAGNERNSRAIAKFANAEIGYFGLKLIVHVLIRGSLGLMKLSICFQAFYLNRFTHDADCRINYLALSLSFHR
jgi:hypothetical protein